MDASFKSFIEADGTYSSPLARVSLIARLLPSASFYARVHIIVYRSSRLARRGELAGERWYRQSLGILRAIEAVGVRVEISGAHNLGSFAGPCVFVSNHMSALETLALPSIILPFKNVTFVIKEGLLKYPLLGTVLKGIRAVAVGRANPREDLRAVLEDGSRLISEGVSIIVFPQTTRSSSLDPREFNSIGVKLAKRAGVPVVPIALRTDAWRNGRLVKDYGPIDPSRIVRFSFGPPMAVKGRGTEEHENTIAFIQGELAKWRLG